MAEFRRMIEQTKADYEQKIETLERRLKAAEQKAETAADTAETAKQASAASTAQRERSGMRALTLGTAFNSKISVILDGNYYHDDVDGEGTELLSEADGSQVLELQKDALRNAGVKSTQCYEDFASGKHDERPGLAACLKALRPGDTLVVWKLDRLGRNLKHLITTVHDLHELGGVGFRVLAGQGADIDTTTASGKLGFGIFAALAEFERELIRERTIAGLASARARGRKGVGSSDSLKHRSVLHKLQ